MISASTLSIKWSCLQGSVMTEVLVNAVWEMCMKPKKLTKKIVGSLDETNQRPGDAVICIALLQHYRGDISRQDICKSSMIQWINCQPSQQVRSVYAKARPWHEICSWVRIFQDHPFCTFAVKHIRQGIPLVPISNAQIHLLHFFKSFHKGSYYRKRGS